jgi:hypothetical protein
MNTSVGTAAALSPRRRGVGIVDEPRHDGRMNAAPGLQEPLFVSASARVGQAAAQHPRGHLRLDDPSLIKAKTFYPAAAAAEKRLAYYASQFPVVEVDTALRCAAPARPCGQSARRPASVQCEGIQAADGAQTPAVFPPDMKPGCLRCPARKTTTTPMCRSAAGRTVNRFIGALPLRRRGSSRRCFSSRRGLPRGWCAVELCVRRTGHLPQ